MDALKNVDILTINDEEARQLSGEYSLVKAARFCRTDQRLIIKKESAGGSFLMTIRCFFVALPLEDVVDPTEQETLLLEALLGLYATKDYSTQ